MERADGFLDTSFMPGREFVSLADFNAQLADWLPHANQRAAAPHRRQTGGHVGVGGGGDEQPAAGGAAGRVE